eukprot:365776-Chlamydomonas_euryale.AAC.18
MSPTQINYQNKDNLIGALIIAGYDEEKKGQVFGCPIGGTLSNEKWAVDGSGSTFIWGYCDAAYRQAISEMPVSQVACPVHKDKEKREAGCMPACAAPQRCFSALRSLGRPCVSISSHWPQRRDNFTRAEAEAFVEEGVALAMSSDCSSGGCIRLVTVNSEGAHHKYINGSQAPKFQDELNVPGPATGGMILGTVTRTWSPAPLPFTWSGKVGLAHVNTLKHLPCFAAGQPYTGCIHGWANVLMGYHTGGTSC